MMLPGEQATGESPLGFATISHAGVERASNEDACGTYAEGSNHLLVAVADGVSGEEGAALASATAIEVVLRAYSQSPPAWGPSRRLYRAVQQANIEIHDRALVVTELRRMATTLTAIVIDGPTVHAAHVGDSRLYSVRAGRIDQRTKDHASGGAHPMLTRSVGRELIAAVDRITFPIGEGDALVLCTDGLYRLLDDQEIRDIVAGTGAFEACTALVAAAIARGAPDNVTVGVVRIAGDLGAPSPSAWRKLLGRFGLEPIPVDRMPSR